MAKIFFNVAWGRFIASFDPKYDPNKNVINKDKVEYNLNNSRIRSEIRDGISKALGISESIIRVEVRQ